jgi:hypothetical protein
MVGLRHEDDVLAMPAFSIAVFDSTGAPLGSIPTPASLGTFGVSRSGPFVYLYEETPHPHIVKYRIDMPDRMERDE